MNQIENRTMPEEATKPTMGERLKDSDQEDIHILRTQLQDINTKIDILNQKIASDSEIESLKNEVLELREKIQQDQRKLEQLYNLFR